VFKLEFLVDLSVPHHVFGGASVKFAAQEGRRLSSKLRRFNVVFVKVIVGVC